MSSLREIDHDLDQITVDAALLAEVQKGVAARGKIALQNADQELAALANGTTPRAVVAKDAVAPPPVAPEEDAPPSGQIDVPDDVLRSSELPAVLALEAGPPAAEPVAPLALDLEADLAGADFHDGSTSLEEDTDLAPVKTSASIVPPVEAPRYELQALEGDDPNADLASLLGDSDPMREDPAEPPPPAELEPEPTMMFSAEDAERFSRPAPPLDEDDGGDLELEVDEIIEIDDEPTAEPEAAAARPRTAPPPPPRTAPPPPPGTRPSEAPQGRGFLGKLLQRKP